MFLSGIKEYARCGSGWERGGGRQAGQTPHTVLVLVRICLFPVTLFFFLLKCQY